MNFFKYMYTCALDSVGTLAQAEATRAGKRNPYKAPVEKEQRPGLAGPIRT